MERVLLPAGRRCRAHPWRIDHRSATARSAQMQGGTAMPFVLTLGFATEHDRDEFLNRALHRIRGQVTDAAIAPAEPDGIHRIGIAVTSPSAARDVCHQVVSFLSHAKNARVNLAWHGANGEPQYGEIAGSALKDAEIVAVRVGAAARTCLDREKEAPPQTG